MAAEAHRQDRELARAAAGGDDEAWRTIYETSCQQLFNLLCYQTGDREAAKDLLQETYLTATRRLEHYRGEGSLRGWLRTIALRKSLDWRRRLGRRLGWLKAFAAESETQVAPSDDARLDVEGTAFRRALHTLSASQRAALLLRELESLSFREVAATLGCREATARVHYHRAREKMRALLTPDDDPALADQMGGQRA